MTIAELNIACALSHIEALRKHGAQVTGPDGERVELNSYFYDTVKDRCLNFNEAVCPKQMIKQSICIDGDTGEVMKLLLSSTAGMP